MTTGGNPKFCQNCEMHGRNAVPATQVYRGFNGETTFACDSCHADALNLISILSVGGPYAGEVGSKGGGASADMAHYWNGKSGELRKRVFDYVCKHGAAGAEDIAQAIGEPADNVSPRCSELTTDKYGNLFTKGPRTARTAMGSRAHVYQLNGVAA